MTAITSPHLDAPLIPKSGDLARRKAPRLSFARWQQPAKRPMVIEAALSAARAARGMRFLFQNRSDSAGDLPHGQGQERSPLNYGGAPDYYSIEQGAARSAKASDQVGE